jgi:DNA polymerase-4
VSGQRLGDEDWADAMKLEPTQDTVELADALEKMWVRRRPLPPRARPLLVAVTLTQLEQACNHTASLFATEAGRRRGLLKAVDKLNLVYGYGAVYWAGAHAAREAAPMRIAFNRVPSLELEKETDWQGLRRAGMKMK